MNQFKLDSSVAFKIHTYLCNRHHRLILEHFQDFPGRSVVKTPCFHCRGCGFDLWLSGN